MCCNQMECLQLMINCGQDAHITWPGPDLLALTHHSPHIDKAVKRQHHHKVLSQSCNKYTHRQSRRPDSMLEMRCLLTTAAGEVIRPIPESQPSRDPAPCVATVNSGW